MRIILTQAEIEEAIEKLILDQVAVPDDMRIDIDLKATRGEEGYQAFIDIVAHDAPDDGTDRSVDPRVEVLPGAETLDIAAKVIEAKEAAARPRRRGRPAGARNLPKHPETAEADKVQVTETEPVKGNEIELEPAQEPQEAVLEGNEGELVLDTPIVEETAEAAPVATGEVVQAETVVQEAQPLTPEVPVEAQAEQVEAVATTEVEADSEADSNVPEIFNEPDAPAPVTEDEVEAEEVDYTPTPETKGFETNQSEDDSQTSDEVVEHVPAATVTETDKTSQEPEVEAAPEAAPEAATAAEQAPEQVAEVVPPAAPTKSLFANLVRPNRN